MSRSARRPAPVLVFTCEHADHRVPREYAALFRGAGDVLTSHRGWDPGALRIARLLAKRLARPLYVTRWSRLLVEANRSPHNPHLWSRYTRPLPKAEREQLLERYWWPHRRDVETAIERALGRGRRVVHVAVHSFVPVLDGRVRNADVCFLYDSRRPREAAFARRWRARLRGHAPELRVRFNYPYLGTADGLATWLRSRHPAARYLGYELEVNQALASGPGWRRVAEALAASLDEARAGRGADTAAQPRSAAGHRGAS